MRRIKKIVSEYPNMLIDYIWLNENTMELEICLLSAYNEEKDFREDGDKIRDEIISLGYPYVEYENNCSSPYYTIYIII